MLGNWKGRALDETERILLTAEGDIFLCHIFYFLFSCMSWTADGGLEFDVALSQTAMKVLQCAAERAAGQHAGVCSIPTP